MGVSTLEVVAPNFLHLVHTIFYKSLGPGFLQCDWSATTSELHPLTHHDTLEVSRLEETPLLA